MPRADVTYICNAEVATWDGDRWLLIRRGFGERHAAGTLALVGGKVEEKDPEQAVLEETVRREFDEEVGLQLTGELHYVSSALFFLPDRTGVINIVFCAPFPGGRPTIQDADEVAEITWLTADEVRKSDAPEWTKSYIAQAERVRVRLAAN